MYILRCADGSLYIGHTSTIDDRVTRHNEGGRRRERQIKRWTRAKKRGTDCLQN